MTTPDDNDVTDAPVASAEIYQVWDRKITSFQRSLMDIYILRGSYPEAWVGMFAILEMVKIPQGKSGWSLEETLAREVLKGAPLSQRARYVLDSKDKLYPSVWDVTKYNQGLKKGQAEVKSIESRRQRTFFLLTSTIFFLNHVRAYDEQNRWEFDDEDRRALLAAEHAVYHYIDGYCGTQDSHVASAKCQGLKNGPWWKLVQEVGERLNIPQAAK